jgi:peroxiredoxin (alkyl hydroperoxide reductase subunit C)
MATFSNQKKHRQFGFKLLIIAIIIAVTFTVWYLSEKHDRYANYSGKGWDSIQIPGDDLKDLKTVYLDSAKNLMKDGYENITLANDFKFQASILEINSTGLTDARRFWQGFAANFGIIDPTSVKYFVLGNQVKIYFISKKDNKKHYFWRIVSLGNYDKPGRTALKPVLEEEAFLEVSDHNALSTDTSAKIGTYVSRLFEPEDLIMPGVADGKILTVDLGQEIQNSWTMIYFFPGAFTNVCPTDCMELLQNLDKLHDMKIKVFAVGADLPATQMAWVKSYFGRMPVTLLTDLDLSVSDKFGMANYQEWDPYRGMVILDMTGKIRYMSVQDYQIPRNYEDIFRIFKILQTPELKPDIK